MSSAGIDQAIERIAADPDFATLGLERSERAAIVRLVRRGAHRVVDGPGLGPRGRRLRGAGLRPGVHLHQLGRRAAQQHVCARPVPGHLRPVTERARAAREDRGALSGPPRAAGLHGGWAGDGGHRRQARSLARLPAVFGWTDEGRDVVAEALSVHRRRVGGRDVRPARAGRRAHPDGDGAGPAILGQLAPAWAAADRRARSRVTLAPATSRRLLWTPHRPHEACRWITGALAHEAAVAAELRAAATGALVGARRRPHRAGLLPGAAGPDAADAGTVRGRPGVCRARLRPAPRSRRARHRRWHPGGRVEPPGPIRAHRRARTGVAGPWPEFDEACLREVTAGSMTRSPRCGGRPRWRRRSWRPSRSWWCIRGPGVGSGTAPPLVDVGRTVDHGPAVPRRHAGRDWPRRSSTRRCTTCATSPSAARPGSGRRGGGDPDRVALDGQPAPAVGIPAGLPRVGRPCAPSGPGPAAGARSTRRGRRSAGPWPSAASRPGHRSTGSRRRSGALVDPLVVEAIASVSAREPPARLPGTVAAPRHGAPAVRRRVPPADRAGGPGPARPARVRAPGDRHRRRRVPPRRGREPQRDPPCPARRPRRVRRGQHGRAPGGRAGALRHGRRRARSTGVTRRVTPSATTRSQSPTTPRAGGRSPMRSSACGRRSTRPPPPASSTRRRRPTRSGIAASLHFADRTYHRVVRALLVPLSPRDRRAPARFLRHDATDVKAADARGAAPPPGHRAAVGPAPPRSCPPRRRTGTASGPARSGPPARLPSSPAGRPSAPCAPEVTEAALRRARPASGHHPRGRRHRASTGSASRASTRSRRD